MCPQSSVYKREDISRTDRYCKRDALSFQSGLPRGYRKDVVLTARIRYVFLVTVLLNWYVLVDPCSKLTCYLFLMGQVSTTLWGNRNHMRHGTLVLRTILLHVKHVLHAYSVIHESPSTYQIFILLSVDECVMKRTASPQYATLHTHDRKPFIILVIRKSRIFACVRF